MPAFPFTYEFIQQIGFMPGGTAADLQNAQSYQYERITVCVDDTGVTALQFYGKMDVLEKTSQNAALLPFEKIIKTFEEQVFNHYSLTDPGNKNPQSPVKSTFFIKRITLGYTRVSQKDKQGEYLLVPVWDFFGSMQNEYDMDAVEKDLIRRGGTQEQIDICLENYEAIQDKEVSNGYNSFLSINAIDGSIINRTYGY